MKRSVVLLCGSALAALSLGASTASAVPCVPTPYVQDAHALTAQLANPPDALVPPNVDATGCDIGIFYNDGGPHHLVNKSVFGATYYGVLSISPGTTTNITKSSMYDVGDQPTFTGTQHGISVAYRDGADGQVDHTQLYDYQKGGVLANGAGTDVQVLSNVVRGQGPTPVIAQNGVQISRGATGHVNDNLIEDHEYTGCTKQQDRAGTCTYVVSTGILLFAVEPSLVDTKNNLFRNNDVNLLNASNAPA
ncbi:MAG: hypothetical protein E6G68_10280 [Actinobacteria bacterium]|nr:MAG: hypothetical protein E6G68_10280 [Actinomycetota bacterium]